MLTFNLPFPQSPICDGQGIINRDWYLFLSGISTAAGNGTAANVADIQATIELRRMRSEIDQLRNQINDMQLLLLAQQRTNGASVSQNSRVANGRMDGP